MTANKKFTAIGAMSGTSLDGLDLALCSFVSSNNQWRFKLLNTKYIPYDTSIAKMLKDAYNSGAREFVKADIFFGKFIGEQILSFKKDLKTKIDLVASHGHTIFHAPSDGYTSQIGSGAVIAGICGLPTVSDFRQQDIAYGGQGAPLVPIGDDYLFAEYSACLNLGGFANISYKAQDKRIAFDICAVNFVLNYLSKKSGYDFDKDGFLSSSGKIDTNLLVKLESLAFYNFAAPKSLGQEWVDNNILPLIENYPIEKVADCLRTYTEHVALQIVKNLNDISGKDILVTGGGAKNTYLIDRIKTKTNKKILIPANDIIDFKEAIIFAFLGVLRWCNKTNSLASVTGAKKDTCCGALYMS